jgi:hypothetical protein
MKHHDPHRRKEERKKKHGELAPNTTLKEPLREIGDLAYLIFASPPPDIEQRLIKSFIATFGSPQRAYGALVATRNALQSVEKQRMQELNTALAGGTKT